MIQQNSHADERRAAFEKWWQREVIDATGNRFAYDKGELEWAYRAGAESAIKDKLLNPEMPAQELRLHCGELTQSEILVARTVIRWANTRCQAQARTVAPKSDPSFPSCNGESMAYEKTDRTAVRDDSAMDIDAPHKTSWS